IGAPTAISIRPHDIKLSATQPPGENAVPGTVTRQVFLGGSRDYMVEVKDGTQFASSPPRAKAPPGEVLSGCICRRINAGHSSDRRRISRGAKQQKSSFRRIRHEGFKERFKNITPRRRDRLGRARYRRRVLDPRALGRAAG